MIKANADLPEAPNVEATILRLMDSPSVHPGMNGVKYANENETVSCLSTLGMTAKGGSWDDD